MQSNKLQSCLKPGVKPSKLHQIWIWNFGLHFSCFVVLSRYRTCLMHITHHYTSRSYRRSCLICSTFEKSMFIEIYTRTSHSFFHPALQKIVHLSSQNNHHQQLYHLHHRFPPWNGYSYEEIPWIFTTKRSCEGPRATALGKLRGTCGLNSNQRQLSFNSPAGLPANRWQTSNGPHFWQFSRVAAKMIMMMMISF